MTNQAQGAPGAQPEAVATEQSVTSPGPLTRDQELGHYIDMWKQAVEVQMHFNDIEWRIRGLALTVATFALGAAGVAAKDGTRVGWLSLGALVIVIGLLLWYAFYFVDRVWYHPLLKASVAHGTQIENEIKKSLNQAGMTASITAGSAYDTSGIVRWLSRRETMHSDDKLVWFYMVGAVALGLAAIALQIGALLQASVTGNPASPTPTPTPEVTRSTGCPSSVLHGVHEPVTGIRVIDHPAFNPVEMSTRSATVTIRRVPPMARSAQPQPTGPSTRSCLDALTPPINS